MDTPATIHAFWFGATADEDDEPDIVARQSALWWKKQPEVDAEIRLRFALKGVQGGQLRDMCKQVGLDVVAIRRLRIGKVSLAKMPVGVWRYLPVGERF